MTGTNDRNDRRDLPDLPCAVFVELVTDYLDGALGPDERARVETHLAACPHCRTVLEQWRAVVALAGRLPEQQVDALDAGVRGDLMQAFRLSRGTA